MNGCGICKGAFTTKCMFCGYKAKKKKVEKTDHEKVLQTAAKEKRKWLEEMWWKLHNMNMTTSGSAQVDREIREECGDWE